MGLMNLQSDWERRFRREIQDAIEARSRGNEGKARVCSRRAAGIVVNEYYRRAGERLLITSFYKNLERLAADQAVESTVRDVVNHFLVKVNYDKSLPLDADLILDANWLAERLLQYKGDA